MNLESIYLGIGAVVTWALAIAIGGGALVALFGIIWSWSCAWHWAREWRAGKWLDQFSGCTSGERDALWDKLSESLDRTHLPKEERAKVLRLFLAMTSKRPDQHATANEVAPQDSESEEVHRELDIRGIGRDGINRSEGDGVVVPTVMTLWARVQKTIHDAERKVRKDCKEQYQERNAQL